MVFEIVRTRRFKTAYKRVCQLTAFREYVFEDVVQSLATGKRLNKKYRDHPLTGTLTGYRECHLAPDILLVYQIDNGLLILTLVSIGNHAQLFK